LRPQRFEKRLVGAAQFQVIQTRSAGQQVERDIENVIGFVVRKVQLEQRDSLVNLLPQIKLPDQLHDRTDPPAETACCFSANSYWIASVPIMGEAPDQLDLSMRESTRLLRDFSWRRILSFTRKPPCGVV